VHDIMTECYSATRSNTFHSRRQGREVGIRSNGRRLQVNPLLHSLCDDQPQYISLLQVNPLLHSLCDERESSRLSCRFLFFLSLINHNNNLLTVCSNRQVIFSFHQRHNRFPIGPAFCVHFAFEIPNLQIYVQWSIWKGNENIEKVVQKYPRRRNISTIVINILCYASEI
jgi:hypothetical protein